MQAVLGGNTFPPYTIPLLPTASDPSQARAPCLRVQVLCIYLPRIYSVDGRNTQQQQQARRLSQKMNLHPRSRAHECEERTIHSLIRARIGMRNKDGMRTRPSQGLILLRNGESLLSLAYPRGMVRGASLQNPRSSHPCDHSTPQRTARPPEDGAPQLGDRAPSLASPMTSYACLPIPPLRQTDASQSIARAFPSLHFSTASTRMERPRAARRDSVRAERPLLAVPVSAPRPPPNTNAQPAFHRRAILPFRTLTREYA